MGSFCHGYHFGCGDRGGGLTLHPCGGVRSFPLAGVLSKGGAQEGSEECTSSQVMSWWKGTSSQEKHSEAGKQCGCDKNREMLWGHGRQWMF